MKINLKDKKKNKAMIIRLPNFMVVFFLRICNTSMLRKKFKQKGIDIDYILKVLVKDFKNIRKNYKGLVILEVEEASGDYIKITI